MRADQTIPVMLSTTAAMVLLFASAATAGDVIYDDFATPYLQRSDTLYPGEGDAKAFNNAAHVIDPWPRHSGNRHIPGNGERMSGAVERYRDVSKLPKAPQPIAPVNIEPSGLSTGGASAGGAAK